MREDKSESKIGCISARQCLDKTMYLMDDDSEIVVITGVLSYLLLKISGFHPYSAEHNLITPASMLRNIGSEITKFANGYSFNIWAKDQQALLLWVLHRKNRLERTSFPCEILNYTKLVDR